MATYAVPCSHPSYPVSNESSERKPGTVVIVNSRIRRAASPARRRSGSPASSSRTGSWVVIGLLVPRATGRPCPDARARDHRARPFRRPRLSVIITGWTLHTPPSTWSATRPSAWPSCAAGSPGVVAFVVVFAAVRWLMRQIWPDQGDLSDVGTDLLRVGTALAVAAVAGLAVGLVAFGRRT